MKMTKKILMLILLLGVSIFSIVLAENSTINTPATPPLGAAKAAVYRLEPECAPDKCLDVQWAGNTNGTPVWLWGITNAYAQLWWLYYQPDGYYKIVPQCAIGKCLDVSGAGTEDGTLVQIWEDNGTAAQKWNLIYMDNGYYELEPACAPGKRLDVQWGANQDQTPIWIWTRNGGAAQRWRLTYVDSLSYYTTCVQDNLNPSDRVEFENQFNALGYTSYGADTNVSSTQLNSLLGYYYTTLYHTGHGYNSGISTSDGGLNVDQVSVVNVKNFIAATCLTLTSTNWINKMGSNCQNVLGYTNVSWDYPVDDNVVITLAGQLRNGWSYIQSWYTANVNQSSLQDRWCGYVREGSVITEYSARTANTPKSAAYMESLTPDGNVKAALNLLSDGRTFDTEFSGVYNTEITIKGTRDNQTEFYQAKSGEFLVKTLISKESAISIAQAWIGNNLPNDAKLDSVTPVEATIGNGASQVIGYIVRYIREINGLPLRTNKVDDHIALLVNNNTVVAMSKVWSNMELKAKTNAVSKGNILSVKQAIRLASAQIALAKKKNTPIEIINVKPCYGITKDGLVPAYELFISDGGSIIVNATTARLIL